MTLPDERYRALARVPEVLHTLAYCTKGPIRKAKLREVVYSLLRHYPTQYELREIARKCPNLLDEDGPWIMRKR